MSNQQTTTGPTQGGESQPLAGDQLRAGDLPALLVRLREISDGGYADMEGADAAEFAIAERLYVTFADAANALEAALAVEPSGATSPSASVLPPPVPCSDARRAARFVTENEKQFVEAYQRLMTAAQKWEESHTIHCKEAYEDERLRLLKAVGALAREISERAEGGGNK